MREPKPTPRPRDRKARRKLSPGQVAFLQRKAEREKAKAERKAKQRLDAWHLLRTRPEVAKARREKGVENNARAWAWRRQSFVDSFADWPSVLTAEEMGYRIRAHWLPSQRKMKWRGCEKHYPDKEASVRKKLTELGVFRYNCTLRVWFRCGSVEEAEATQRLAEQEAERRRLAREEAERAEQAERDRLNKEWEAEQKMKAEAKRLKAQAEAEAEQAERDRLRRPAGRGWHDFIPEELKPTAVQYFRRRGSLRDGQSLDDLAVGYVERFTRPGQAWCLDILKGWSDNYARRMAEAVLVAD
jgi:hypothetical protein